MKCVLEREKEVIGDVRQSKDFFFSSFSMDHSWICVFVLDKCDKFGLHQSRLTNKIIAQNYKLLFASPYNKVEEIKKTFRKFDFR